MSDRRATSGATTARAGAAFAGLALLAGAVEPIAAKLGFRAEATPSQILLSRSLVAASVILLVGRRVARPPRVDAKPAILAGALLFATATLTLVALSRLHVAVVIAIASMTPATVAIASRKRVTLGAKFALGVALCFVGVLVTTGGLRGRADPLGLACGAAAVASSTAYRLRIESLAARHGPMAVSTWIYAVHAVLALVVLAPFVGLPPRSAWIAGAWTGVAAAAANLAFVAALHGLGAARASVVMLLQRPIVVVAAAAFLGEPLGMPEAIGIACIVAGVALARPAPRPQISLEKAT